MTPNALGTPTSLLTPSWILRPGKRQLHRQTAKTPLRYNGGRLGGLNAEELGRQLKLLSKRVS